MFKKMARALLDKRHRGGMPLTPDILEGAWPMMVGDYLASHTRPVRLSAGRLEVVVSSAARMKEFMFLRTELIRRINLLLPVEITDLQFTLARPDQLPATAPLHASDPPLGEVPEVEQALLEGIEDEELRALMTRVRRLSRGRRR